MAAKNRCHNIVDRRHKKRNWARRCDINFLPVVHALDADAPNAIGQGFPRGESQTGRPQGEEFERGEEEEEESYEIPAYEAEPSIRPEEEMEEEEQKKKHREQLKQRLTCRTIKGKFNAFSLE